MNTMFNKSWYPEDLSEDEIAKAVKHRRTWDQFDRGHNYAIDDIGGLTEIMTNVWNIIRYPLERPESSRHIKPTKGLILHGETGVGKTMLIRALAEGCNNYNPQMAAFVANVCLDLGNQVENNMVQLFNTAKQMRPAIIFLDNFHRLAPNRSPNVRTLRALMDELDDNGSVFVVAATKYLDKVDPELRKSGRFDTEIFIGLPNLEARKEILRKIVWNVEPSVIDAVADETSECTGQDLSDFWDAAYRTAMKRIYPNGRSYDESSSDDEEDDEDERIDDEDEDERIDDEDEDERIDDKDEDKRIEDANEDERINYSEFRVEMEDFKDHLGLRRVRIHAD